jgi:hypothetical protein
MGLCWLLVDLYRRCGVLCKSPGADSALHVFVNNMHRISGGKEGKSPNNPASLTTYQILTSRTIAHAPPHTHHRTRSTAHAQPHTHTCSIAEADTKNDSCAVDHDGPAD